MNYAACSATPSCSRSSTTHPHQLVELLALAAIVVTPTETVEVVRDPDDDRLIEAALASHANVIVTGDQDLLTLGHVGQISILTPREFLDALQSGI